MKKTRLYLFTLTGITIIVIIISTFSFTYLFNAAQNKLLTSQLQSSAREAREISTLLDLQLKSGLSEKQVIANLQSSIENTDSQSEFICMYNSEGLELCHPDPSKIGQVIDSKNSIIQNIDNTGSVNFKQLLNNASPGGGIRSFDSKERSAEIVYVYKVAQTNWMVASHANIAVLNKEFYALYNQFLIGHIVASLLVIICSFFMIRFLYNKYAHQMETEKAALNNDLTRMLTLNNQLILSKELLEREISLQTDTIPETKKRVLTYHKDELISLDINNVAFFYLENSVIYIKTFDGKNYPSNSSLDEIMKQIDIQNFFRANRQFIINIRSIDSILVYGKNQIKLVTLPETHEAIIISKNKVAEFKQWLDR